MIYLIKKISRKFDKIFRGRATKSVLTKMSSKFSVGRLKKKNIPASSKYILIKFSKKIVKFPKTPKTLRKLIFYVPKVTDTKSDL